MEGGTTAWIKLFAALTALLFPTRLHLYIIVMCHASSNQQWGKKKMKKTKHFGTCQRGKAWPVEHCGVLFPIGTEELGSTADAELPHVVNMSI